MYVDKKNDVHLVLEQHTELDFYSTSLKTTVHRQPCRITRTHFPDFEPTGLTLTCMQCDQQRSGKYQYCSLWFDSISVRTRLPTEASIPSITQQRLFNCTPFQEHLTSQLVFGDICVARSSVLYIIVCPFSLVHCLSFNQLLLVAPLVSSNLSQFLITLQGKFKEDKLTYFHILFFLPLNSSI